MVTPLFIAALVWERLRLSGRRSAAGRKVSFRLGTHRMRLRPTNLGAGLLFLAMGGLMVGLALSGRSTYTPAFLLGFSQWGSDRLAALAHAVRIVPEWGVDLALLVLLLGLFSLAWTGHSRHLEIPNQEDAPSVLQGSASPLQGSKTTN
jgi:hypothetical protein